ncbi:DUF4214 domain-containing protein [Salipiger sp. PrR002]|uniref:DUF4214 domain-containing protein n=1 Tax=Salipiger sp. PrR002 TaxID=2706489 RepID=UPI0013BC2763|nr:DUF4214 domain-containing protein [Salipiger sp. PrR002]NDW01338.1 DUF4214 domain-containing protein [Salipiger sp. PrR002]NDW58873.1 DUF4214 domain-containing protein [Salipiger sp. PrR004]
MAHLASSYTSFETFLSRADAYWTVDFNALNSSGVNATAILAMETEEDGTSYLNVAITGTGLTPSQTHAQHVHGLFDEDGAPIDSTAPTLADDADRDGMVEVIEGLGQYGDVLLPLASGGAMPMADENGLLSFVQSYDLNDDENFFSPVSMTDYTAEDIMPLTLREIVLHGVDVPDGIGEGTDGEVDGGENGYTGILPAAAGDIESASLEEVMDLLAMQRATASTRTILTDGDDMYDAGAGDDFINGKGGDDSLNGGADNDTISGGSGRDVLYGADGNDLVDASIEDDNQSDAADSGAAGSLSLGDYDNGLAGGAGDDMIRGRAGDDIITGDDDSRVSDALGTMFNAEADGADTIYGGAGNDEIHTGTWADGDQGLENASTGMMSDWASGGMGNDILRGAGGDDTLYGDQGSDNIGGGGGNDVIYGDFMSAGSAEMATGQVIRIYQAAFDRAPDLGGFYNWTERLLTGEHTLAEISTGFTGSAEFAADYDGLGNEGYVQALYNNVLGRDADATGLANWTARLDEGTTRAEVLVGFSQSQEFIRSMADDISEWVMDQGTDDVLMGNGGENLLSGGLLADRFVFSTDAGSSHDVTDLESWDMLDFSAFGYGSADDAVANMMQDGDDLVFMDQDVTVTLQDTMASDLDSSMILV